MELKTAENNLARQNQFKEAQDVYMMLGKLEPVEERKHQRAFVEQSIDRPTRQMRERHASEAARLERRLISREWTERRAQEKEAQVAMLRLANHAEDVRHAHVMDRMRTPELRFPPTMLLQRRARHRDTAVQYRGEQMQSSLYY